MAEVNADKTIDIRGLVCPMTFVRSKLAIEGMKAGEVLKIILDYEGASVNIPRSMRDHGHEVISVEKTGQKEWELLIRKVGD